VVRDLHTNFERVFTREAPLKSLALSHSPLAAGDKFGKIYLISNPLSETPSISTLHWHSQEVSSLQFAGPFLISAGHEAVLVQWHLETQHKQFISRAGAPIQRLLFSTDGLLCGLFESDNSWKIIRTENNKVVKEFRGFNGES